MRWLILLVLLLLATIVFVATVFTIQNSARTAELSLDLYVAAWRLEAPMPVSTLLWMAFGVGFVLAGSWGLVRSTRLSRKVRRLEHQLAVDGARAKPDAWG